MKAAEKASKGGEISMAEKQSANGGEVIVEVQSDGISEAKGSSSKASSSKASESSAPKQSKVNLRVSTESSTSAGFSEPVPVGFPSTDISRASPNPGKPLRVPTCNESLNRRKSFNRSVTKPKSRFGEPSPVMNEDGTEDQIGANSPNSPNRASLSRGSLNNTSGVGDISIPSAGNALSSPGKTEDMEDEEIYKKVYKRREVNSRKVNKIILIELIVFLCILGCLVASLTVQKLENYMVWGLEIWKWLVLVMVIFSGMLVTNWVMHFIIFGIERNFLLRRKVLYFVHGMKKSIQVLMWWSLILVTWLLLLKPGLEQSKISTKILAYVTRSIVSVLIGAFLWLIKILLLKILASKIEAFTYSERIQESIFHHYVLQTLSGPPLMEEADGQIGFRATKKSKAGKKKVVIDRSRRTKQVKVSSWTMKVLADAVTSSGLSTISHTLDEMEGLNEQRDKEITSEMEATTAAYDIFLNVAQLGASYIEEWDLLKFMTEEEAEDVWLLLDVANTGKVDRKTVTEWVVKVYTSREILAHALSDTKAVLAQVDNLVSAIVIVIIMVVSILVVKIATTNFFVFLSSQLVLAAFAFGNTCKNAFESIMFLFVTHPFDVGDRIVFEGVPMIVEEINIFSTVFLKLDNNEKVYYPNSALSAKSISNYSRSPDMRDTIEFSIALTPVEKIVKLKEKIKKYMDRNPQYWHSRHNVAVIDIQDVNKLKMAIYCQHTMNFQDFEKKNLRRAELNLELLKILEELNITLLSAVSSQEVNLNQTN